MCVAVIAHVQHNMHVLHGFCTRAQTISPLFIDLSKEIAVWTLLLSQHQCLLLQDIAYVALARWDTFEVWYAEVDGVLC